MTDHLRPRGQYASAKAAPRRLGFLLPGGGRGSNFNPHNQKKGRTP